MKQYQSIWAPDDSDGPKECFDPEGEPIINLSDVIVMTPDELWEIWAEAANKQVDSETRMKNIEMFNAYFKSKGINI